ncbi:MAG: hypothetical protein WDZ51_02620 [Pirellulaceae bacterium]
MTEEENPFASPETVEPEVEGRAVRQAGVIRSARMAWVSPLLGIVALLVAGLVGGTMLCLFVPLFLLSLAFGIISTTMAVQRMQHYEGVTRHALAGITVNMVLILLLVLGLLWINMVITVAP